jgi:hypothetical protein
MQAPVLAVDPQHLVGGHGRLADAPGAEEYRREANHNRDLGSPPMEPTKPFGSWSSGDGVSPLLTPRTFVRAARLTSLLIIPLVVIEFCVMAAVFRDGKALLVGLTLLLFIILATWATAAVLGGVTLLPRWLWMARRRHLRRSRPSPRGNSGVWDDWLDSPFRP